MVWEEIRMKKSEIKIYLKKISKDKIKQATLLIVACLLFSIGIVNYNLDKNNEKNQMAIVGNENEDMIGDVELVNSGSVVENENVLEGAIVENNETNSENSTSENTSDYFESVRIERDSMYSRMLETYNKMIDNEKLAETQKSIAVQEIDKITNDQNAIMISENLIKNKGFEDAVVFSNDNAINVIVKASALNTEDIGKIQNIIEREFKVSLENVNISNKM